MPLIRCVACLPAPQFYSWYFHTLPFLLWHTRLPTVVRIAVLAGIEYAYNVFPSTSASSAILQVRTGRRRCMANPACLTTVTCACAFSYQACHLVLLLAVYLAPTVYGHEDIVCTRINGDAALRKKLGSRAGAAGGVTVVAVDSKVRLCWCSLLVGLSALGRLTRRLSLFCSALF